MTSRPPVWIGHVSLPTRDLDATERFMRAIGLRPIFRGEEISVMELRGGTHIVLRQDRSHDGAEAEFDFMVEEIDSSHAQVQALGIPVTALERGRIHDSFRVVEPGGNTIVFNSTHVPDHDAV